MVKIDEEFEVLDQCREGLFDLVDDLLIIHSKQKSITLSLVPCQGELFGSSSDSNLESNVESFAFSRRYGVS